jgi:pyruvate dehydrogenase E2 component (dihydrolipoamide acetyltransferase)
MIREVIMPKLGQTMEEGVIVEWLKSEGDPVQRGEVLFTIESDKATLEAEAPGRGFLRKILVPAGESVPVLTVVGLITGQADEDLSEYEAGPAWAAEEEDPDPSTAEAPEEPPVEAGAQPTRERRRLFASPRARMVARENDVDLERVTGTGPNGRIVERDVRAHLAERPKATPVALRLAAQAELDLSTLEGTGPRGRITKDDVERALAAQQAPAPKAEVEAETPEAVSEEPLSGVRAIIAQRMHRSHQVTAPVTLTTEVDATAFVELRTRLKETMAEALGFNLGYNDLLIKLCARALREMPYMNARLEGELDGGTIRRLKQINVALAVDTERGLLVPVVRDADGKGVGEIAREVRELVARARAGQAGPDDLSGGTFTITNLGMHEIDAFTPIINAPETAILGVGRIKPRPAVVDGTICARQMLWLSLTFDHRIVDGAPAARFLQRIKQLVEEPYLLLV